MFNFKSSFHKNIYKILFLLIILFVFVEIKFMRLPIHPSFELDPDEASGGWIARSIGTETDYSIAPYSITFLNRMFPLMNTNRHGALELYFSFPFLLWNGSSIVALRAATLFWGVIIVILTYFFTSKLFSNEVGILATLLLVINSNFINILRWGNCIWFYNAIIYSTCFSIILEMV
jgi:4-amino-4-deoxy-L-arabinose transferase-like glycosyltransferase